MKESNFIQTLSPAQQKEIRYWTYISCSLLGAIAIIIMGIEIPQLHIWWQTRQEYSALALKTASFDMQLAQKRTLKDQHALLQSRLAQLEQYQEQKKNPLPIVQELLKLNSNSIQVQSFTMHHKQRELVCICKDQKEALRLSEHLPLQLPFKEMRLTSFKKSVKGVMCSFKGESAS